MPSPRPIHLTTALFPSSLSLHLPPFSTSSHPCLPMSGALGVSPCCPRWTAGPRPPLFFMLQHIPASGRFSHMNRRVCCLVIHHRRAKYKTSEEEKQ